MTANKPPIFNPSLFSKLALPKPPFKEPVLVPYPAPTFANEISLEALVEASIPEIYYMEVHHPNLYFLPLFRSNNMAAGIIGTFFIFSDVLNPRPLFPI